MVRSRHRKRNPWAAHDEALRHFATYGWPTFDLDRAMAETLYARWLEKTHEEWVLTGSRSRTTLRAAMEDIFVRWYGESEGHYRLIMFAVLHELRARSEGQVKRSLGEN